MLMLRDYNTLSARGHDRLDHLLAADDPTGELGAARGVKETLRLILTSPTIEATRAAKTRHGHPRNHPVHRHHHHRRHEHSN